MFLFLTTMYMKLCKKCDQYKELVDFSKNHKTFDGYENHCKKCKSLYYKKYLEIKGGRKEYFKEYCKKNSKVSPEIRKEKELRKLAKIENEKIKKEKKLAKIEKLKNKIKNRNIKSSMSHEIKKMKQREYVKRRRQYDPVFRLRRALSSRIYIALKRKSFSKKSKTEELLGCNYKELHDYLIQTAINNYGKYDPQIVYHVDHIVPCASAKTEEELNRLFHYTNLQYLTPEDNWKKHAYLIISQR